MKMMLNTLYVTAPEAYLSLDGENVVVLQEDKALGRIPLHNLESIVTFGYTGASPALMGACAQRRISLCFMTRHGRMLARIAGMSSGNVVLRKEQYAISEDESRSMAVARHCILGKLFNCKWVIERAARDHGLRLDMAALKEALERLSESLGSVRQAESLEMLRGVEGKAAVCYFSVMDDLILQQKEDFYFRARSKRPPMDRFNALLSFAYSLLANEVASALETVGLDAYIGFMHTERPGRVSLALDMMEELRPVVADRFVLTMVNTRRIQASDFFAKENGAFYLTDSGRREFLTAWQARKQETLTHPFLEEKISWGLVPYVQAMLLARYIRGDLDAYPPFLWK